MPRILRVAFAVATSFLTGSAHAAPCAGFTDVDDSSPFCSSITWMKNQGITLGCGTGTAYCPADPVRRDQMAAFMFRLGAGVFQQGGNSFGATGHLGTNDAQPLELRANGGRVVRYEPGAISPNVIGGSPANGVTAGVRGATIAGGGAPSGGSDPDFLGTTQPNVVTDAYGTVGGGWGNQAGDAAGTAVDSAFATVAGGFENAAGGSTSFVGGGAANRAPGFRGAVLGGANNLASGYGGAIGGGYGNIASGLYSVVGAGLDNVASGVYATVVGGASNTASGVTSFAAGTGANADRDGCFVFANWSVAGGGSCIGSLHVARFLLDHGLSVDYYSRRPDGGGDRWVYIGDNFAGRTINTWIGAHLTDAGVWVDASSSKASKTDFADVDPQQVLERVAALPITTWRYREGEGEVRHIGPMAEDFHAAFGVGYGPHTIADLDARGVALAAIQGLNAKLEATVMAQAREIAQLRTMVERLLAAR